MIAFPYAGGRQIRNRRANVGQERTGDEGDSPRIPSGFRSRFDSDCLVRAGQGGRPPMVTPAAARCGEEWEGAYRSLPPSAGSRACTRSITDFGRESCWGKIPRTRRRIPRAKPWHPLPRGLLSQRSDVQEVASLFRIIIVAPFSLRSLRAVSLPCSVAAIYSRPGGKFRGGSYCWCPVPRPGTRTRSSSIRRNCETMSTIAR